MIYPTYMIYMEKQVYSSLHHQFSVPYEHITDILHQIVSSFNLNSGSMRQGDHFSQTKKSRRNR